MLDATQIFDGTLPSTGAAITTTRVSTNIIDLLSARDVGAGDPLGIHVQVITAFTAGGAATLRVALEVGATAGGTFYSIIETPLIPVAQLIAGEQIMRYALPPNEVLNATTGVLNTPGRYLRLNYTVATGPMLTGTIFAYINPRQDRQVFTAYPRGYTSYTDPDQI